MLFIWTVGLMSFSCGGGAAPAGKAKTPADVYKKLYSAVKSKDSEAIRRVLSKNSLKLARGAAAQNKKPLEQVLEHGLTATTYADKLPAIRDARIKGNYAAIEVWNQKRGSWEDLPFVMENGEWKLAVGDLFAGTFVSPGKSRTTIERENANAMRKTKLVPYGNGNVNTNLSNMRPIKPRERKRPKNKTSR